MRVEAVIFVFMQDELKLKQVLSSTQTGATDKTAKTLLIHLTETLIAAVVAGLVVAEVDSFIL
jgi:hypothetical protein